MVTDNTYTEEVLSEEDQKKNKKEELAALKQTADCSGKIIILVDIKSNTPLLAYHAKLESEDAQILMLVNKYLKSTRYQKAPGHLKVRNIANYLKNKGYKAVDFEMREV